MDFDLTLVWGTLLLLGAFHGINPAMGWLFAVALGLQERRRRAVWRSLLPLALGHALAIGVAITLAGVIGLVIPLSYLKWIVAGTLFALGIRQLVRHGHPRYGGMQVGFRDLTIWSFLMASAHGAGLMVLPLLFGSPAEAPVPIAPSAAGMHDAAHAHHAHDALSAAGTGTSEVAASGHADHLVAMLGGVSGEPALGLFAMLIHTLGYLVVLGLVAILIYEKLGLRLLRSAWINLDIVWAGALIATGALSLLL